MIRLTTPTYSLRSFPNNSVAVVVNILSDGLLLERGLSPGLRQFLRACDILTDHTAVICFGAEWRTKLLAAVSDFTGMEEVSKQRRLAARFR